MKRVLAAITAVALMASSQAGASASLGTADRASSFGLRGAQNAVGDGDWLSLASDGGMLVMVLGMLVIVGVAIDGNNDDPQSP